MINKIKLFTLALVAGAGSLLGLSAHATENATATAAITTVAGDITDTFVAFFTDNVVTILVIFLLLLGLMFLLRITRMFGGRR